MVNKICKAMTVLAIAIAFTSLFGCKNKPEYTTDDIESLSISCGQMDLSKSYSFGIYLKDDNWIFYADCFATDGDVQIKLETPIKNEEAQNLLAEAEKSGFIASLQEYKKPIFKTKVADEPIYSSAVTLSDGNTISAPILAGGNVENGFYTLAEKYGKNNN